MGEGVTHSTKNSYKSQGEVMYMLHGDLIKGEKRMEAGRAVRK